MPYKKVWLIVVLALLIGASPLTRAETPDLGQKAPEFTLSTPEGHPLSLSEFTPKGTVVLVVLRGFPGYQCPYCQRQVHDFLMSADKFAALTGIDQAVSRRLGGRFEVGEFRREFDRRNGKVTGRYDASVEGFDPYPDSSYFHFGDPSGDSLTAPLTIIKATPTITWNNPVGIPYGTALSGTQLNATADVGGNFVYTPVSGTVLNAGNGQTLHVDFTPTDTTGYNNASKDVTINVGKAPLSITADANVATLGVDHFSKTYDGHVYTGFTARYVGFVNSETETAISWTASVQVTPFGNPT